MTHRLIVRLVPLLFMSGLAWAEGPPRWSDVPQTYCMVPVLPETAQRLNVSVNGVWGGINSVHPMLTGEEMVPAVRKTYGEDVAAFVRDSREAGLIVTGVVNGLEGFPELKERWPDLETMACRKADGSVAATDEMILMCTNNPKWLQWEIDYGRRAIKDGADVILVDTPMSSSFIAGFLGGGFCAHCLGRFRTYLWEKFSPEDLEERFGIQGQDLAGLKDRLRPFQFIGGDQREAFVEDSPDARLYREFILCQEEASFETRKELVGTLRAYAKASDRSVAFTTNAADLSTSNPGGHWVRGIMFADLFDYFTYEQDLMPEGLPFGAVTRLPRGKWAAYHKLGFAIHHRRSPAVFHASHMGQLLLGIIQEKQSYNAWTAAQSAEAYAANGAYVQFYIEPQPGFDLFEKKCWQGAGEHARFVLDHRDLYSGNLYSGSKAAVVFLYNERGRAIPAVCPSYLGFAQALIEGNYPFDVVFGGDGKYVEDRLSREKLARYDVLIVPSPIDPTANQRQLLQDAARRGATLVCMEPERLGLDGEPITMYRPDCLERTSSFGKGTVHVLRGTVTVNAMDDAGTQFFRSHTAEARSELLTLAEFTGLRSIMPGQQDDLVAAFPLEQPTHNRTVVHVVNYDIDYEADSVREKTTIELEVPQPQFLKGNPTATLLGPGDERALPLQLEAGVTRCTIPKLGAWAVLVVGGK